MTPSQNNYIIAAAFSIALLLSLIFARFFSPPPRKQFVVFSFFILAFLSMWTFQLWVFPYHLSWFNVSWIQLLFAAAVFSILVIVISPAGSKVKKEEQADENPLVIFGILFWALTFALITSIFMGYKHNDYLQKPVAETHSSESYIKQAAHEN